MVSVKFLGHTVYKIFDNFTLAVSASSDTIDAWPSMISHHQSVGHVAISRMYERISHRRSILRLPIEAVTAPAADLRRRSNRKVESRRQLVSPRRSQSPIFRITFCIVCCARGDSATTRTWPSLCSVRYRWQHNLTRSDTDTDVYFVRYAAIRSAMSISVAYIVIFVTSCPKFWYLCSFGIFPRSLRLSWNIRNAYPA